jgi:CRISPR/Cas system-associated exonuclease Cas4 (RecB family)
MSDVVLPKVVSASQINTYLNCPFKFKYQYVDKLPITESEVMKFGSHIHSKIAKGDFESDDEKAKRMLEEAKSFLGDMPTKPIFETTYEDRNNPGRFWGNVFGRRAIAILDAHWVKSPKTLKTIALDWKTGKFHQNYTGSFEIQAYIGSKLYEQAYEDPLDYFYFKFLASGDVYEAKCLHNTRSQKSVETKIQKALDGMKSGDFPKKHTPLCSYCDYAALCSLGNVGRKQCL